MTKTEAEPPRPEQSRTPCALHAKVPRMCMRAAAACDNPLLPRSNKLVIEPSPCYWQDVQTEPNRPGVRPEHPAGRAAIYV